MFQSYASMCHMYYIFISEGHQSLIFGKFHCAFTNGSFVNLHLQTFHISLGTGIMCTAAISVMSLRRFFWSRNKQGQSRVNQNPRMKVGWIRHNGGNEPSVKMTRGLLKNV